MNRLAIRLQIQPGEALSSYILRLVAANGLSYISFLNFICKTKYKLNSGNLNRLDGLPLILIDMEKFKYITKINEQQIFMGTLTNLIHLFRGTNSKRNCRFLDGLVRETFSYCIECMSLKKIGRLMWKISEVSICCKHKTYLNNECPSCCRNIYYKDITQIGYCPYCGFELSMAISRKVKNFHLLEYENWINRNLSYLIANDKDRELITIQSEDLAQKLLYILNDKNEELDKNFIINKIGPSLYRHYLQSARGTNKKCTVHFKILCEVLFNHNIEMTQFMKLDISDLFKNSLFQEKRKRTTKCAAPWCAMYEIEGALIPTTSKQVTHGKNGERLSHYHFCKMCGVEYAFNSNNRLVERSYFIQSYHILLHYNPRTLTWPEKEKLLGIKKDRILRVYAYFKSRGKFTDHRMLEGLEVETDKLQFAISMIKGGSDINSVRFSEFWCCPNEYLLYRYHQDFINVIQKVPKQKNEKTVDLDFANRVKQACIKMIKNNEVITVPAVAERVGCNHVTIYNQGCENVVANYKLIQIDKMRINTKQKIIDRVHEYFELHSNRVIYAKEIYAFIDMTRVTIKKLDPELCSEIDRIRMQRKELIEMTS